ncbi:hypothetical protein A0H81_06057 [Grifola frondosa]|uniref:Xylanolytic transcriptional activator regulatory domain-containing protein n=1 Tax=Grifola frondosa TaxID=5627 RepID=A0A1C7MFH8_GRIFR|nr:hypothetical protein A0H81_06057 [Grifola frondosa]
MALWLRSEDTAPGSKSQGTGRLPLHLPKLIHLHSPLFAISEYHFARLYPSKREPLIVNNQCMRLSRVPSASALARRAMLATRANGVATVQRPAVIVILLRRLAPTPTRRGALYPHRECDSGTFFRDCDGFPSGFVFGNDADTKAKRSRVDRPEPNAASPSSADPSPPSSQSEPLLESPTTGNASILLDPTTTHELVNLFFAHCNPQRMIIHKPSFSAALSHNTVPSHLVLAVCALAAPLSKTVSALSSPARLAGVPFFQKAVSLMFDSEGHLLSEPSLTTAQSLCLLEMHEIAASHSWTRQFRYFELALQVLEESLEVHKPDTPLLSATNTPDSLNTFIQRECTRRCFWLIQTLAWITRIYTLKPVRPRSIELAELVRLPIDETTFELAVLSNSATSEFLHRPAPRTRYASQFGHVCRILEIYQNMESVLAIQDPHARAVAVGKSRRVLQDWEASLPAHLQFTEDNLEQQVAMFDTSSNTGAWCFCFMHVLHPCCFLAVLEGEGSLAEPIPWHTFGMHFMSYSKYSRDDPQLEVWDRDFEKVWASEWLLSPINGGTLRHS